MGPRRLRLLGDDRGAVTVEYMAVFAFVSMVFVLALIAIGPNLLNGWTLTRTMLLANKP
jgi:Flp pilus assembly pilin Flp